ncbi:AsnC family protein [Streptomyces mirabilis]|uniref:AsnC family protein n=1 Tax=Streptomyces mirabilis TaxID=68239 RepID=UPI0036DEEBBA
MEREEAEPMPSRALDALDLRLLQCLQIDGRAPLTRIAEVLGVSDQTVACGGCAPRHGCGCSA